jgi:hypothetical protein
VPSARRGQENNDVRESRAKENIKRGAIYPPICINRHKRVEFAIGKSCLGKERGANA